MSEPQPAPQQQPEKQPDTLVFFPIGIALMSSGLALTVSTGWAGIALVFSGLTFVILSVPAVKAYLAKRRADKQTP